MDHALGWKADARNQQAIRYQNESLRDSFVIGVVCSSGDSLATRKRIREEMRKEVRMMSHTSQLKGLNQEAREMEYSAGSWQKKTLTHHYGTYFYPHVMQRNKRSLISIYLQQNIPRLGKK